MIDLTPLKAELCEARQTDRKFCRIHRDELQALISKAEELLKVQEFIPFKVGFSDPDELHKILQGEQFRGAVQRKKGKKHTIEMLVRYLPPPSKKPVDVVAE
jgi:hypothetical protein